MIDCLESPEFIRVRVGIAHPDCAPADKEAGVIKHVLSHFRREEKPVIDQVILRVSNALFVLITRGIEPAMNEFNRSADKRTISFD